MHVQWCKHNATVLKLCPYCTLCTETAVETCDHYIEYTVHITCTQFTTDLLKY